MVVPSPKSRLSGPLYNIMLPEDRAAFLEYAPVLLPITGLSCIYCSGSGPISRGGDMGGRRSAIPYPGFLVQAGSYPDRGSPVIGRSIPSPVEEEWSCEGFSLP